ncbi:MAG: type II secretion system F family protein [archaeon]
MNLLKIYPRTFRNLLIRNSVNAGIVNPEVYQSNLLVASFIISLVASSVVLLLDILGIYFLSPRTWLSGLITLLGTLIFINVVIYFRIFLKADARIKKMENIFPDVIQLMASNLRAGMTVDRAFLLSARPEFAPLDLEIGKTGREITTGKDMGTAMLSMSKRIGSEKIHKTIMLIISGLKAGGNISTLLEETANNMREKEFIEKKAASSIVMYVIFIFFASAIGAPVLFGLSSILVQVIIEVIGSLPEMTTSVATSIKTPFTFSSLDISISFVIWFSVIFLIITNILSSLVIGLVNKGSEKEGLRYLLPLIALSLAIFFTIRTVLFRFIAESFSMAK